MNKEKVSSQSMDVEEVELNKLKTLFPQCFTEGKLDTEKLLSLVGKYAVKEHERYNFEWKGKNDCYRLAALRSQATLRPCPQESVNFDTTKNLYIEGDNLEVLKTLQKAYYGRVKMIYIDPPYNTGNDFVYEDDFKDPLAKYKELTEQATKSNPETAGRFHTNWLNMMFPRLRLAYNLLRDDGVIFISIDDNEVTNLRKLCDEVFGEENFVAQVIWQKIHSTKNDAKYFSENHDYILVYAKQIINFSVNLLSRTEEMNSRYKNPDNDPRGPWQSGDLVANGERSTGYYDVRSPKTGKVFNVEKGKHWVYSQDNLEEMIANNEIWFGADGNAFPRKKRFLKDVQDGRKPNTIWLSNEVGHNQTAARELKDLFDDQKYFDYPKPVELIKHLLQIGTTGNDVVLDFFSGSATTAHAVMELNAEDGGNRRFICVQLPEVCDEKSEAYKAGYKNICEIGKERIRRAGKKIQQAYKDKLPLDRQEPLDTGFKVFKLDTSNLVAWDTTPTTSERELYNRMDALADTLKKDRTDLDVVYEVMLKLSVPLDAPIQKLNVNGKEVYSVGTEHELLVCLNYDAKTLTQQDIEYMCKTYAPGKIVAAEAAFADDAALANAYFTLKNREVVIKLI